MQYLLRQLKEEKTLVYQRVTPLFAFSTVKWGIIT